MGYLYLFCLCQVYFGRLRTGVSVLFDDGRRTEYKKDPRRVHDVTIEFTSHNAHRGVRKRIFITKWTKSVYGVANPRIEDGWRTEQNMVYDTAAEMDRPWARRQSRSASLNPWHRLRSPRVCEHCTNWRSSNSHTLVLESLSEPGCCSCCCDAGAATWSELPPLSPPVSAAPIVWPCVKQKAVGKVSCTYIHKKVKVAHTWLPSVGFRSKSRFLAVSLQVTWVINPAISCHYFPWLSRALSLSFSSVLARQAKCMRKPYSCL